MDIAELRSDIDNARGAKPRTFDAWLKTADQEEIDLVLAAISDDTIPANALMVALRKNGIPITPRTIEEYRGAR